MSNGAAHVRIGKGPPGLHALAAVAVLLVLAGVWWATRGELIPASIGADEAKPIAEAFLTNVRSGKADRVDAAWESTSAEFKSGQGKEQFRKYVRGHKVLTAPSEFQNCEMSEANGVRVARCTFKAASGAQLVVLLAPEQGKWKVERLIAD